MLCWFVIWENGKGMVLAAVRAFQVSVWLFCSQAGQAAPLLPSRLVCEQLGVTRLGRFPVWGPSQQQGASQGWEGRYDSESSRW